MSEVNENRIRIIFDLVQEGNVKKALKQIQSYQSKKHNSVDKCYFNTATALVYGRMNKIEEARVLLQDTIKSIVEQKLSGDSALVDHVSVIAKELGCFDQVLNLYQKMWEKDQGNKQMAEKLFNCYAGEGQYYKMYMVANQIATKFNDQNYKSHAAVSLYFFSKDKAAPPGSIDMAKMSLDFLPKDNRGIADVYIQLLCDKEMFNEAVEFLNKHESLYPMVVERKRILSQLEEKAGNMQKSMDITLEIIRENYLNPKQFQSIYDLHELITVRTLTQNSSSQIDLNITETDSPFKSTEPQNLYSSFSQYLNFQLDDKTSEAHNLRKASILSTQFVVHKALLKGMVKKEDAQKVFISLSIRYLSDYCEMPSAVIDISPYIAQLADRESFIKEYEQVLESKDKSNPLRVLRRSITLLKVKKVLGHFKFESKQSFTQSNEFKSMLELYRDGLSTDGKPEKGERKAADDAIQIILEILDEFPSTEISSYDILYHCLGEKLKETSEYNYDVTLRQLYKNREIGAFSLYKERLLQLDIKGVQLESMNSLHLGYVIENCSSQFFQDYLLRYDKYQKSNTKELKSLKNKVFSHKNYVQLEEFSSYEDFLENSYTYSLINFLRQNKSMSDNINDQEYLETFFKQRASDFLKPAQASSSTFTMTQDLSVLLPKFQVLPNDFEKIQSVQGFQYNDKILNEITEGDNLLKYFKYDNKSNYKPYLFHSMGIFEDQEWFRIKNQVMYLVSQEFFQVNKVQEESKTQEESKENLSQLFNIKEIQSNISHYKQEGLDKQFLNKSLPLLNKDILSSELILTFIELVKSIQVVAENKQDQDKAVEIIEKETMPIVQKLNEFKDFVEFEEGTSVSNQRKTLAILTQFFMPLFVIILRQLTKQKESLQKKKKKGNTGPNPYIESVKQNIQVPIKEWLQHFQQSFEALIASLKQPQELPQDFIENPLIDSEFVKKEIEILQKDIKFNQQQILQESEKVFKLVKEEVKSF